jgi:hypothetical protein
VGNQLAHREKATHTKNASILVPHFPGRWRNNRNRTKAKGKGQTSPFLTGQISPSAFLPLSEKEGSQVNLHLPENSAVADLLMPATNCSACMRKCRKAQVEEVTSEWHTNCHQAKFRSKFWTGDRKCEHSLLPFWCWYPLGTGRLGKDKHNLTINIRRPHQSRQSGRVGAQKRIGN